MEHSFLAYLRGRCRSLPQVAVGIGDDAAVIEGNGDDWIACTDQIIDGVDFVTSELAKSGHDLGDVGYKSVAINLSDVAAMGAVAHCVLVTLSLPRENASQIGGELYEGILAAAGEFGLAVAGGDLSTYDGPLAISVTVLGHVPHGSAWLRSGAREGDAIVVTGAFGGSLLGRHLRPQPRLRVAAELRGRVDVRAAIDVSDGLSLDLDRLCAASRVGAELDLAQIPIHPDAVKRAAESGRTPFEHAWADGEDFELILAMSQEDADSLRDAEVTAPLTQIGNIVGRTGLWERTPSKLRRLAPQGFEHVGGGAPAS